MNPKEAWVNLGGVWQSVAAVGVVLAVLAGMVGSWRVLDGPIPASRQYVVGETKPMKIGLLQLRLGQVYANEARDNERKDYLTTELGKAADEATKRIIRDRISEVNGQLMRYERTKVNILKDLHDLGWRED